MSYKAGVYNIYCTAPTAHKNLYMGSSKDIVGQRWPQHIKALRNNKHKCRPLQASWNKYGEDAFVFNVVEHVIEPLTSAKQLTDVEQKYIDAYWDTGTLFNTQPIASSSLGRKGYHFRVVRAPATQETRDKISATLKGRPQPWNTGNKGGVPWNKGKKGEYKLPPHSESARQKISESNMGKHNTGEPNLKLIEAWTRRPSTKGVPLPEAHRQAIKESWKLRRLKSATPDSTE
jgi:group I intron endonuclease